ncbi:MAG: hypothetical protein JW839_15625 [Candidatus Lokiarchaeota archaeon]|nr:hypothetical protein [Candidatus Lokiarchaeota archaeon]
MEMPAHQQQAKDLTRKILAFVKRWWLHMVVGLVLGILLGYINGLISALVI